jgi:glycosyltransferase involved in cell wall biosynthesis
MSYAVMLEVASAFLSYSLFTSSKGRSKMTKSSRASKILILAFSDISRDPRVMRQINWLKNQYQIVVAGYSPPNDYSIPFIDISKTKIKNATQTYERSKLLEYVRFIKGYIAKVPGTVLVWTKLKSCFTNFFQRSTDDAQQKINCIDSDKRCENYYLSKLESQCNIEAITGVTYDLIVANDIDCLVLAKLFLSGCRVVFDAHEYAPLEYNYDSDWWVIHEKPAREWACRKFLSQISGMSTVCDGIGLEFKRNFPVAVDIRIITNAPSYHEIPINETVVNTKIKVIHHGLGAPLRKIELMIEAAILLADTHELYLMLVNGDEQYIKGLQFKYQDFKNIHFMDPVPMLDIVQHISRFDIGIFILEPEIFNYKFALPNKFFEFIQARLAIAVGPSPEMSRIVNQYDLGVVATDFTSASMAIVLASLSLKQINQFKRNADSCARDYNSEVNCNIMIDLVETALMKPISVGCE